MSSDKGTFIGTKWETRVFGWLVLVIDCLKPKIKQLNASFIQLTHICLPYWKCRHFRLTDFKKSNFNYYNNNKNNKIK